MDILNGWQRWIFPTPSQNRRTDENQKRSRSMPSSPRLWIEEAIRNHETQRVISYADGEVTRQRPSHRSSHSPQKTLPSPRSEQWAGRSPSPCISSSDSGESESEWTTPAKHVYHSNGTRFDAQPAQIFSSRRAGAATSRLNNNNHRQQSPRELAAEQTTSSILHMYQDLRLEHKELEKQHRHAVQQNESLVRSICELERALANARAERPPGESHWAQIRELREANVKLREELREKVLQLAELRTKKDTQERTTHPSQQTGSSPRTKEATEMQQELDALRLEHARERLRRRKLEGEVQSLLLLKEENAARTTEGQSGWSVRAVSDHTHMSARR